MIEFGYTGSIDGTMLRSQRSTYETCDTEVIERPSRISCESNAHLLSRQTISVDHHGLLIQKSWIDLLDRTHAEETIDREQMIGDAQQCPPTVLNVEDVGDIHQYDRRENVGVREILFGMIIEDQIIEDMQENEDHSHGCDQS